MQAKVNRATLSSLLVGAAAFGMFPDNRCSARAAEPVPVHSASTGAPAGDFESILKTHTNAAFQSVADYVTRTPSAGDLDAAFDWLFSTALDHGLEAKAVPLAEACLGRGDTAPALRSKAMRVRGVGLAKAGRLNEALAVLDEHLKGASIRSPNDAIDFAFAIVAQAQLAGQFDAVPEILDRLASKFFLNAEVRGLVERRKARLALAGQPAPEISVADLDGRPVDLGEYRGKVLLVDFWATTCAPCVEAFPDMRRLYNLHHPKGFEIVGVSLDEDATIVKTFREKSRLPWRMALSSTDIERTRERYHAETIPSLFLIDRDGRVAYVDLRGGDLRSAVEKLLGGPP
jgi:peroxiredoxin